jgi:hypothetical protein
MLPAASAHPTARGAMLLLEHCAALDLDERRPTARWRLERVLGSELAHLLVRALTREARTLVRADAPA